ncbi:MAG TPA: hypothetical protein VM283_06645, partial [Armatimonadota bacterium]|nr:hypothetical protein [Armatimonadota bacterium]
MQPMTGALLAVMGLALSVAGAGAAGPREEPPRTYLFLYAESPAEALYAREHGSPYRHEPWMSDERWEAFYASTQQSYPRLLDLTRELLPDILYLAANGQFQLFGMDATDIPTVAQVQDLMGALGQEAAEYERLGAGNVGFYRCAISIRGNPEQRHGIFALYDRWEQYADVFGLGPKPPEDPMQWLQIRFDSGKPYIRAWDKPDAGGNIGYFCCPNNPYWRQFSVAMATTGARVGYTNLFVDNPSVFCKCKWCREAFAEHQRTHFTPEQWARLFPGIAYGEGDIEDPRLAVERDRFWQESVAAEMAAMKAGMQAALPGRRILLAANGSQMTLGPWYTSRANLAQYAACGVNLGFKESPFEFSGMNMRPVGNGLLTVEPGNIYDTYRLIRGAGADDYYGCPAQSYDNIMDHDDLYRLAMSEALAMDGCFLDGAAVGAPVTMRPAMYGYLERNRALFAAGASIARVAVIIGASEFYFDDDFRADAARDADAIRDWLSDQQIPFDYLIDDATTPERLARYDIVIVPGFKSLRDAAADALRGYAATGGSLILSGPVGAYYASGPARPAPVFADLLAQAEPKNGLLIASVGKGRIVACPRRFADADLPDGFSTTQYTVARPQTYGGKTRGPMLPVCVETNRALFLSALSACAHTRLSVVLNYDLPGLRVAGRYRTDVEAPWLNLHLINEQMPMRYNDTGGAFFLDQDGTPTSYSNVHLVIPMPEGFVPGRVTWAQVPGSEPQELPFLTFYEGAAFDLPAVELYAVVHVDLQPGQLPPSPVLAGPPIQLPHRGQGLYVVDPSAPKLEPITGDGRGQAAAMRLNFTHPSLIYARAGDQVQLQIAAFGPEGKWARWWAVNPNGKLLRTGAVACGQTADVTLDAPWDGVYLVQAQADANDFAISSSTHAICLPATPAQRVNFRAQPPELYFRVPAGQQNITLQLQSRDRDGVWEVVDSKGNVLARRDGQGQTTVMDPGGAMVWSEKSSGAVYQKVVVPVPEGEAGTIWRLRFTTTATDSQLVSNFYFDDSVPGIVSTTADGLLLP